MSDKILAQDLEAKLGQSDAPLILDVRGGEEYAAGHIPGARHIPLDQLEQSLAELPQDTPIVTYCNMRHPGQSRGEQAAALLRQHDFDALVLDKGFTGWEENGLPVEA